MLTFGLTKTAITLRAVFVLTVLSTIVKLALETSDLVGTATRGSSTVSASSDAPSSSSETFRLTLQRSLPSLASQFVKPKAWYMKSMVEQLDQDQFQCWVARKYEFKVCASPKVSTTFWKNIFCRLNGHTKCSVRRMDWVQENTSQYDTILDEGNNPTIVRIVRDPLERLLSAYIDKCVDVRKRFSQGHCKTVEQTSSIKRELDFTKPSTFEEWVDLLPHEWDPHVFPQCIEAFYSEPSLHRYNPQKYTNVVTLDGDYYKNIMKVVRSVKRFGSPEVTLIDNAFKKMATRARLTKGNVFSRFYTKAAISRAVQYYAFDYTYLNMTLPTWIDSIKT